MQELVTELHMQSIFTDVGKLSLQDPAHSALIPSSAGTTASPGTSFAWLSYHGDAHFALASPAGGITVVTLPPPDSQGEEEFLCLMWAWPVGRFLRRVLTVSRQRVGAGVEEELCDAAAVRVDAHGDPRRAQPGRPGAQPRRAGAGGRLLHLCAVSGPPPAHVVAQGDDITHTNTLLMFNI